MSLGDARSGKLADNVTGFGRALRRAGVKVDSSRIALAKEAALAVGLSEKADLSAAFEAVMVSREQDRLVFRELFDVYFQDPKLANKLLAQLLPSAEGKAEPSKRRPRVREALTAQQTYGQQAKPSTEDQKIEFDAVMTASDIQRLQHADFNSLSATEYRLVEKLARDIQLPLPEFKSRRSRPAGSGARIHWPGVMHHAARTGGELMHLPRLQRRQQPRQLFSRADILGTGAGALSTEIEDLHPLSHQALRLCQGPFGAIEATAVAEGIGGDIDHPHHVGALPPAQAHQAATGT
jgi:uncharacterized protein with von Willebrand factor type A (vWA) domain